MYVIYNIHWSAVHYTSMDVCIPCLYSLLQSTITLRPWCRLLLLLVLLLVVVDPVSAAAAATAAAISSNVLWVRLSALASPRFTHSVTGEGC